MEETESDDHGRRDIESPGQAQPASNETQLVEAERQRNIMENQNHVWTPKEVGQILRKLGDQVESRATGRTDSRAQRKG